MVEVPDCQGQYRILSRSSVTYQIFDVARCDVPRLSISHGPQQRKKNEEKDAQPSKINREIVFSDLRNPPKHLRCCLARSSKLGHTQNTKNKRAAATKKLNIACPKPPSKVRAIGARRLVPVKKKGGETKQKERPQTKKKESTKHPRPPNDHGARGNKCMTFKHNKFRPDASYISPATRA